MIKRVISQTACASALFVASTSSVFADHGKNFHCDRMPFLSEPAKKAMDELAPNNGMRKIVSIYARQWESEEMRRICDAGAVGQKADTSCLEGRRNWDAIASKIPEGLVGKTNIELRPLMLELMDRESQAGERKKVMKHCAKLGVVDPAFK